MLGNYRKGSMPTLRKNKRVYPTDTAFTFLYKINIEESFWGKLAETVVINACNATSFWKNGNEIDVIHNDIPLEVKYQEQITKEDVKPLREFMKKFNKKEAILITKNKEDTQTVEEGVIQYIPLWRWLVTLNPK